MPVAVDDFTLLAQQFQCRLILVLIQLIRIFDAQLGTVIFQEKGRIGNVNGAVKCLDPALMPSSGR